MSSGTVRHHLVKTPSCTLTDLKKLTSLQKRHGAINSPVRSISDLCFRSLHKAPQSSANRERDSWLFSIIIRRTGDYAEP
jgi:hypothetical protein